MAAANVLKAVTYSGTGRFHFRSAMTYALTAMNVQ